MLNKFYLTSILLVILGLSIQSCGDDDEPVKNVLITSHRGTGQFYKVDLATGATTEIFTIKEGATTLKDLRAFVYHPKVNKFFISEATNSGGDLFSVDPTTKAATLINDNSGGSGGTEYEVWDAVVNWAVASDDSLISVGDFNSDGNGMVKFGTNGGRSKKTIIADICCALGLIYDAKTGDFTIGNSENNVDGEVIIEKFNKSGVSQSETKITTLTGFPDDLSTHWLSPKCLAKASDGTIYGILFSSDNSKSYFVKVDITGAKITYISTMGADSNNQYNLLAFIPENKI